MKYEDIHNQQKSALNLQIRHLEEQVSLKETEYIKMKKEYDDAIDKLQNNIATVKIEL